MDNIITNANGMKVKVRVYDFGDKTSDRYTIVCISGKSNNHNNALYYPIFSCSSNPFHPQGIAMYVGDYYPWKRKTYNFGKRVKHSTGITRRKLRARLIIDGEPDARSWWIRS